MCNNTRYHKRKKVEVDPTHAKKTNNRPELTSSGIYYLKKKKSPTFRNWEKWNNTRDHKKKKIVMKTKKTKK